MAPKRVAGELYESITGQLFEIGRQLRQPNGYPYDPAKLKKRLQEAIEGNFEGIGGKNVSSFVYDKTKDGWTLLEDVSEPSEISISSLELVIFLNRGESYVSGDTL